MDKDIFKETPYGKAALKKLNDHKKTPDNFRLFSAALAGEDSIEVRGAEFREAKSGINKGLLKIMIKGTERKVYVSKSEINEFEKLPK